MELNPIVDLMEVGVILRGIQRSYTISRTNTFQELFDEPPYYRDRILKYGEAVDRFAGFDKKTPSKTREISMR